MAGRSTDPTDNLKKRPAKGILKTSSSFEVEDGPSVIFRSRKDKPKNKGTKWDEMNIIETLHPLGKDYGHMKIEEPKTPYERSVLELEETDGVDADTLARKLEESSSKPLKSLARLEESDSEDDLTPEEKERKKAFESKRKAHYNEFLAAKKALKELKDEDDDEDEETVGSGGSPGADSASPKRK
ncbi:hypothetical protein AAG570_004557 [Ranatra chinensis]|uniref:Protein phosphatase inhibitor 2 n=1 Tax=Ranatra chinensis TaxID=642074 RepID=A0ABD0Y1A5_9HEMI